jgi:Leucine-rich repeat (LRR) protein
MSAWFVMQVFDCSRCGHLKELTSLCSLFSLQELRLYDLNADDSTQISHCLAGLTAMTKLELMCCCQLRRLSVGNLTRLRVLDLSLCSELCGLDAAMSKLTNLQQLVLRDCHHLQALPEQLGNLQSLEVLNLLCCCELQTLPHSFTSLSNLERLDLRECRQLEGQQVTVLSHLARLTELDLRGSAWGRELAGSDQTGTPAAVLHALVQVVPGRWLQAGVSGVSRCIQTDCICIKQTCRNIELI